MAGKFFAVLKLTEPCMLIRGFLIVGTGNILVLAVKPPVKIKKLFPTSRNTQHLMRTIQTLRIPLQINKK